MSQDSLGLTSGAVTVVPYDTRWIGLFDEASLEIASALGPAMLVIHHVGSTSVPGLHAKPVLDILVSIPDFPRGLALDRVS